MDRAPASGAGCAGSIPARRTSKVPESLENQGFLKFITEKRPGIGFRKEPLFHAGFRNYAEQSADQRQTKRQTEHRGGESNRGEGLGCSGKGEGGPAPQGERGFVCGQQKDLLCQ